MPERPVANFSDVCFCLSVQLEVDRPAYPAAWSSKHCDGWQHIPPVIAPITPDSPFQFSRLPCWRSPPFPGIGGECLQPIRWAIKFLVTSRAHSYRFGGVTIASTHSLSNHRSAEPIDKDDVDRLAKRDRDQTGFQTVTWNWNANDLSACKWLRAPATTCRQTAS
jgi:hypothetical protein